MADQFDLKSVEFNLPLAAGTIPLMYIPKSSGGITLVNVYLNPFSNGTVASFKLVKMDNTGTPQISGTLGTITTAQGTLVAYAPVALTINTAYVGPGTAAGCWLGAAYPTGLIAQAQLEVNYLVGK